MAVTFAVSQLFRTQVECGGDAPAACEQVGQTKQTCGGVAKTGRNVGNAELRSGRQVLGKPAAVSWDRLGYHAKTALCQT